MNYSLLFKLAGTLNLIIPNGLFPSKTIGPSTDFTTLLPRTQNLTISPTTTTQIRTTISTTTPKPFPPNYQPYNRMFNFMSRGFDVRSQNLANLSSNSQAWKHQMFSYEPSSSLSEPNTIFWTDPISGKVFAFPDFVQTPDNDTYDYNTTQNSIVLTKLFHRFVDLEPWLRPDDMTVKYPNNFETQFKKSVLDGYVSAEVSCQ